MALDPIYLCSRDDVIGRFGGAGDLTQAIDPQQTGTYDTDILDRARLDASSDVMAAAGNRVKLWLDPTGLGTPQWVVKLVAQRALVYVWDYGTNGKARAENIQKLFEQGERDFANLRNGDTGTGYGEPPNRTSFRPRIDNSDQGRRRVYRVWRRSGWG